MLENNPKHGKNHCNARPQEAYCFNSILHKRPAPVRDPRWSSIIAELYKSSISAAIQEAEHLQKPAILAGDSGPSAGTFLSIAGSLLLYILDQMCFQIFWSAFFPPIQKSFNRVNQGSFTIFKVTKRRLDSDLPSPSSCWAFLNRWSDAAFTTW